jgi:hypothetical protein
MGKQEVRQAASEQLVASFFGSSQQPEGGETALDLAGKKKKNNANKMIAAFD